MKVQKVIPEKIINSCPDCISQHSANILKTPCMGKYYQIEGIPSDCPLKNYEWKDKPDKNDLSDEDIISWYFGDEPQEKK